MAQSKSLSLIASGAFTATQSTAVYSNEDGTIQGLHAIVNVTAIAGGSITPKIEGYDATSGNYYSVLTGAAITTTGINILKIHPGISPVANWVARDILPSAWRITITHATADSTTYSLGVNFLP